jgi:CysZ protein
MNFFDGIRFFTAGARRAFTPEVRPFVVVPAVVSLVIIVAGLALAFSYVTDLSNYLISLLPGWLDFLSWIIEPLLYLSGFLIGAWSFGLIATVVGSPFLGDLSIRVERLATDPVPWWKQLGPTMLRELRKLRYHLPRLLLLVVVSIVPVLNTFAPLLWLGFGAWMMAVQFCDYTTENRLHDFSDTLELLSANRPAALGFGVCVTVGMSIPLLNFIVAPIAVTGGTLLMQQIRESRS